MYASANVLESANTEASARVVSFMVVLSCLVVTLHHFGYRSSNRVALALVQAFADWDRKLVTRRNSSLGLVRLMYLGAQFAAQIQRRNHLVALPLLQN